MDSTLLLCQTTWMGFNRTAVKTAVGELGSGAAGTLEAPDPLELQLKNGAREWVEQFSRQARAVLCGPYERGIPSLVGAYEKLSSAGMRVLSPSGFDLVAESDGLVTNQHEVGIVPEVTDRLRLNFIRTADLVWLHAPDGFVDLSGAMEIGFANAAGVPVYAEEMPSDIALRSLVTICPLDQAIAETSTGERDNPGASIFPLQDYDSATAHHRVHEHKSPQDIMLLITEEIGELSRQNPGQRQRLSRTS